MKEFTITEDFPKSEIEFDMRFSNPSACYDYLFCLKWPDGFVCKKCGNKTCWISKKRLYIRVLKQCKDTHKKSVV